MKRRRIFSCILAWLVSLCYITFKGNLLNSHSMLVFFDVDLVLILIVYLFAYYSETGAGIFAGIQGLIIDVLSGGFRGLFIFLYLLIYMGIRLGSRPIDILSTGGQFIIILLGVFLKTAILVFLLYLFSFDITFLLHDLAATASSAFFTATIAPIVFILLNFFRTVNGEADNEI